MTLKERQALVMKDILSAETNFEEGSVSRQYLDFFRWLQDHTDIFDPVMVAITMDGQEGNRNALRFTDEAMKELVNTYLDADK